MPNKKYSKRKPRRQGWRSLKRKKQLKHKLKLFFLALAVLFCTALLYTFIQLWGHFTNKQVRAEKLPQLRSFYATNSGFNIFVAERRTDLAGSWVLDNPKLLIINKLAKKAALIELPYDLEINTKTYGVVKLSGFGKVFGSSWGEEKYLADLEASLGVPIEGVFISRQGLLDIDLSDSGFLSLSSWHQVIIPNKANIYTNLSIANIIDLALFRGGLLEDSIFEFQWEQRAVSNILEREDFLKEALRVGIVNGSQTEGLASTEAEKLGSVGIKIADVLGLTEFDEIVLPDKSDYNLLLLSSKNLANMKTVEYLEKRYQAKIAYDDDCKYPAILVLFHER